MLFIILIVSLMAGSSARFDDVKPIDKRTKELKMKVSIPRDPTKKRTVYLGQKLNYEKKIKSIMDKLSLEEKIGQLLMLSFTGKDASNAKYLVNQISPGGFILFSYNVDNSKNGKFLLQKTLSKIRESSIQKNNIPPFISVDQEGGKVLRLRGVGTAVSSMMSLGATKSPELTKKTAELVGGELSALGINFNLAPVLDTNKNPKNKVIGVRAFSDNYNTVSRLGESYIKGLQSKGVLATAKHFPGHGETVADSHYQIPILNKTEYELEREDWLPFKNAINNGVDAVMVGHIAIPYIDKGSKIATFSKKLITKILKEKLGFGGIVISDDMMMLPVSSNPISASIKAINSGIDVLILSGDSKSKYNIYMGLLHAVKVGEISISRIDEALRRILYVKLKGGLFKQNSNITALKKVGSLKNYKMAKLTAERSLTVVKGLTLLKDLDDDFILLSQFKSFRYFLEKNGLEPDFIKFPISYSFDVVNKVVSKLSGKNKTLIVTLVNDWNSDIIRIIKAKAPRAKILAISLDSPYYYNQLGMFVDGFICSYSYRTVSLQALAKLISKHAKNMMLGQLPVHLKSYRYDNYYGFNK